MKEISLILNQFQESQRRGERGVLATVVDVQGSSYRRPGAKMLILESGATSGMVSGGCLEADVMERARKVWQTGVPQIFVYDTAQNENSIFSWNMGCRGVIRILLEPLPSAAEYLFFWENCLLRRKKGLIATCIGASAPGSDQTGRRVFFDRAGRGGGNFEANGFSASLAADVRAALEKEKSIVKPYRSAHGEVEFFLETVTPPVALVVFGAGADAVPLAQIGRQLGWQLSVVDHRAAFLTKERFPDADQLILKTPENPAGGLVLDDRSAAVMMTHNYERDREILSALLKSEAFYIGALGPKRRTENLLAELGARGEIFPAERLAKLFAPVGLDIGGETPEAIALAIAAEIQSVLKNREGGFLRRRQGPIYDRSE